MDPAYVAAAVLLFEGTAAVSRSGGIEYLSTWCVKTHGEPEGFAGPNDHWTFVRDVCQVVDDRGGTGTPLGIDRSVSR